MPKKTKTEEPPEEVETGLEELRKEMAPFRDQITEAVKKTKAAELEKIAEFSKNHGSRIPTMSVEMKGKTLCVSLDEPSARNDLLLRAVKAKAFGVKDQHLAASQLSKVLDASVPTKQFNTAAYNSVLNLMYEIAPTDPVEGMLASQMVAVHSLAMETLQRAQNAERIPAFESYTREANRLLRTYSAQTEALKKYRAKANQTVRVERVYVNEGGQAIVGDVHHNGGGGTQKSEGQSHAKQVTDAPEPTMRCEDTKRDAVPVTGTKREEPV